MKCLRLALAGLVLLSGSAAAASDQATCEPFDLWLPAHNSGERKQLEAFHVKYKLSSDVRNDLKFRESIGALQLAQIRTCTPTTVEALVVSEWGNALLARMNFDPKDAYNLLNMEFEGATTPAAFKPVAMPLDELKAEAKRRLDALEAEGKVSGTVLLAHDGQPIFEWAGGLADREASVPVTAATQFRMASLGKMFTAVSILQLAQAGKLSLDDRLSKHLVDYPNRAVADAITLRQLLSHTSGTGDVFGDKFNEISGSLKTHHDYWAAFGATPLEFAPGSQDHYSNYGYILLGSVIEAVSGQSYYDYVEQHIYRPAGMTSTGSLPESESVPQRANAYTQVDGAWTKETRTLPWRGTAAGGSYTTAGDLMRFATALTNATLLSPDSLQQAIRPQNIEAWYGYGFMVSGEGEERQFGHEGGASGMNAILNVQPDRGYTVVGLGNFDPSALANMVNFITRRLPDSGASVATPVTPASKGR